MCVCANRERERERENVTHRFTHFARLLFIEIIPVASAAGDAHTAASFARQLLSRGAEPGLRSRWTNMSALHYAAYFDVPQLIRVVLQASQPGGEERECWIEGELRASFFF